MSTVATHHIVDHKSEMTNLPMVKRRPVAIMFFTVALVSIMSRLITPLILVRPASDSKNTHKLLRCCKVIHVHTAMHNNISNDYCRRACCVHNSDNVLRVLYVIHELFISQAYCISSIMFNTFKIILELHQRLK